MTGDDVTLGELVDASSALREWFKSQDLTPAMSVLVSEMFIARSMTANMISANDLEVKFKLCDTTIRDFSQVLRGK